MKGWAAKVNKTELELAVKETVNGIPFAIVDNGTHADGTRKVGWKKRDGIYLTIQAAIDAGHSHILVADGTYGRFDINRAGVHVQGSGYNTRIFHTGDGNIPVHLTADYSMVSDMSSEGVQGGGYGGYTFAFGAQYCQGKNLWVRASDSEGIFFTPTAVHCSVDQVVVKNCDDFDIRTYGGSTYCSVSNAKIVTSAINAGVYSSGSYSQWKNIHVANSGTGNPFTCTADQGNFSNIRINLGGSTGQMNISSSYNTFSGISMVGASTTNKVGFSGDFNSMVGLMEASGGGGASIIFNAGADYNYVSGTRNSSITDNGTGNNHSNTVQF